MSDITFVRPDQLPDPSELGQAWFDRLELSDQHRRHYSHLSPNEVRFLEAARGAIESYKYTGILQETKTTAGLIRRLGEEIDRNWVKTGHGRAVDFKAVLEVLERYAEYRRWATQYLRRGRSAENGSESPLDLTFPYWLQPRSTNGERHHGPGFLRISVTVKGISTGKLGEIRWDMATITLWEGDFNTPTDRFAWSPTEHEQIDPFVFLKEFAGSRTFTGKKYLGLISWMRASLEDEITGRIVPPIIEPSKLERLDIRNDAACIQFSHPTVKELQNILNLLAVLIYSTGGSRHQLQFDVTDEAITVATRLNVNGCQPRTGPLNPPTP